MPSLRTLSSAILIAGLGMPLTACSERDANQALARFQALLQQLDRERHREYASDPFNRHYDRDQNFRDRWPSGVPRPREGGAPPDWVANPSRDDPEMGSNWGNGSGEQYGEQLENAGFERTSQTTETDPATGREDTTSTYRNEDGTEVDVYERGDNLHVVTRPAR